MIKGFKSLVRFIKTLYYLIISDLDLVMANNRKLDSNGICVEGWTKRRETPAERILRVIG